MMISQWHRLRTVMLIVTLAGAAGCSETGFMDAFGVGKNSPDERNLNPNQSLVMPPDLQLKPPGSGAKPSGSQASGTQHTSGDNVALVKPDQTQSPSVEPPAHQLPAEPSRTTTALKQPSVPSQPAAPSQPSVSGAAPAVPNPPAGTNGQQPSAQQDKYAALGISRYRADGTKKSQRELDDEVRKIRKERERQNNPNYGTIWNMPSIWKE